MDIEKLKRLVREIIAESQRLSVTHTAEKQAQVNYACVFTQSNAEYEEMLEVANQLGSVVQETEMGPVFQIPPLATVAGFLQLLKIRRPDPKRPERGDADFTVSNYKSFKGRYLNKPHFSIIKRADMEMIELIDPAYNVLAYYSHPPLADVLKLKLS